MSRLAHLRAAIPCLRAGAHDRVADGFERFVRGEEESLDAALGVRPASSQGRSARHLARIDLRNRLLCEAATEFLPGLSHRAQAAELHRRLRRYAASGWLHERALDAPPAARVGTIEEHLWAILRAWADVLGEERIRFILGRGLGVATTHARPDVDLDTPPEVPR